AQRRHRGAVHTGPLRQHLEPAEGKDTDCRESDQQASRRHVHVSGPPWGKKRSIGDAMHSNRQPAGMTGNSCILVCPAAGILPPPPGVGGEMPDSAMGSRRGCAYSVNSPERKLRPGERVLHHERVSLAMAIEGAEAVGGGIR